MCKENVIKIKTNTVKQVNVQSNEYENEMLFIIPEMVNIRKLHITTLTIELFHTDFAYGMGSQGRVRSACIARPCSASLGSIYAYEHWQGLWSDSHVPCQHLDFTRCKSYIIPNINDSCEPYYRHWSSLKSSSFYLHSLVKVFSGSFCKAN